MINRSLNYGRHLIEDFLKKSHPYASALDIGAGHGDDLEIARSVNQSARLMAIEAYPTYVKELTERNIDVYSLDVERARFPLKDSSIDIVIANQVLEHVKEIFWIFHEVSRVLKVGGKFIIGVPNLASLHNRLLLAVGRQPTPIKNNSAHVRGYTKSDILNFVDSCYPSGYKLTGFGGSNFYPFPPVIAHRLARLFPTMAWGIFLMLEKQRPYTREFLDYPIINKLETNFYTGES